MKRPWLLPSLVGLELVCAVVLAALSALHIYYTVLNNHQARQLHNYNMNRQAMVALTRDSVTYGSQSNRAVLQALIDSGLPLNVITNVTGVAPTPAPAKTVTPKANR